MLYFRILTAMADAQGILEEEDPPVGLLESLADRSPDEGDHQTNSLSKEVILKYKKNSSEIMRK